MWLPALFESGHNLVGIILCRKLSHQFVCDEEGFYIIENMWILDRQNMLRFPAQGLRAFEHLAAFNNKEASLAATLFVFERADEFDGGILCGRDRKHHTAIGYNNAKLNLERYSA